MGAAGSGAGPAGTLVGAGAGADAGGGPTACCGAVGSCPFRVADPVGRAVFFACFGATRLITTRWGAGRFLLFFGFALGLTTFAGFANERLGPFTPRANAAGGRTSNRAATRQTKSRTDKECRVEKRMGTFWLHSGGQSSPNRVIPRLFTRSREHSARSGLPATGDTLGL